MTTPTIHPIVLETLQRFNRQRRRLIVWRGICSTVAMWLATMMLVALIDRFILIPDGLRLGLSLAGYVATTVMFWIECGQKLTHRPDARELARLVELAAPQLREELLAAIELGEGGNQPRWDSDEFRAALQQATARDVGAMHVEELLTSRLIARWVYAVVIAGTLLLVLLGIPGLRFLHSFARAVAPAANLARYSSIQITVTAPTPPDQIVPEGDTVPVTVVVTGADVQKVMLEIFPHHGPCERTPMLLSAVDQFTATVQLNQEPVQFRIRAQESLTRKHTLTPRPRPHVVRFQKTYCFPAYSQLPAKTVTEENGDLDTLEGATVELNLAVDQPIKEASLQLDTGTGKTTKTEVPLVQSDSRHLSARIPMTASGIYQVHLVAAQTGFVNKFSPQYEIRIRPDLIPFAKIDKPEKDDLVLAPDSVINIVGSAKDDLALARVEQQIKVNRGAWQTFLLTQTTNVEIKVTRTWDLFDLGVHPGDQVITKLVATDRKGQRGESAPLRIRIATAGFDPDRLTALKERQVLDKSIHDFRDAADQLVAEIFEARAIVNNPAADQLQKKQSLLAAAAAVDTTERKAVEVVRQIKNVLPHITGARESADLALIGATISRAQHEDVASIKTALERATEHTNSGDDKATKSDLDKVLGPLATGTALARTADDTDRQLLAAMEARAAGRDLQLLAAEQRTLNDQLRATANDVAQTERAVHRQAVAAVETKSIEEQLKTLGDQAGGGVANIVRNLEHNLTLNREALEQVLSAEPSVETLTAPAEQLQHSVENAATTLRNTSRDLDQRADATRKNLQEQTGTVADAVAKITAKPDSWQAAADQLTDRAALEERRPHADAPFIVAVGKTADAVQALQDVAGSNTLAAARAIEAALRKLETGHAIDEQVAALHQLAAQERWEKPTTPTDAMDRVNDWKSQQQQLQALPQQFARAQLPDEAKRAVENTAQSPAAQQVNTEMMQRQADPAGVNNIGLPLSKLADDLAQTRQRLQPALDQARAEIEKRAPELSDRLAGLAHAAEKLNTDTTVQAQQAAKPENANQVRAAAQNLAAAQQQLDNRIDNVKDAVRRDANAQNLGTDEGRARARDADDATALLRQPTPNANNLLQQAANTAQPEQQQKNLQAAAAQQAKLGDDLKLLAEHYKSNEADQPDATRAALREAEKELGLKPTLDAEYAKAQALEKLAGLTPQEQLAELESALANSKPMRRELSDIAKDVLQSAAADLQKSADKERLIAQQPVIEQAKHIADEAQKIVRQDVPAIARQTGEIAKPELNDAAQKLASVAQNIPQDAMKQPAQLAQAIQNQVAPLLQTATDLDKAATKLDQAAQEKTNSGNPAADKQTQAAAQQAKQASEHANQLAQQAGQLATALNPATPQEQATRIAEATKKLAQQDLPAVAENAGPTVQPELNDAGEKLASVAQNLPPDLVKPPAQLAQALQNQVTPLQQAATDLNTVATKLAQKADTAAQQAQANKANPVAAKQSQAAAQQAQAAQQQVQQASQQAAQLAQQAGQLANALEPAKPEQQGRHIADEAQRLAKQSVPTIAEKAGPTAKLELTTAGQQLESVAQNTPRDFSKSPGQLAQQMQNQVAPLQQAATDLNNAASQLDQAAQAAQQKMDGAKSANANPDIVKQAEAAQQQVHAAAQQAQRASQQAGQLAQQAGKLAKALNEINPPPTAAQAQQIAAAAQQLARQDLPALAQQAALTVKPELNNAGQKLAAVVQNIPQDFSKPPEQLVQQMQNQVAPLQQAATDLNNAAAKLGQAAVAAQQKADAAAQAVQQARANNAGEAVVKQAEAAQQQTHTAAQQAQAAQQQAQHASQQAGQLAQQAGQLANALNQAKPQLQAIAQQLAIAESVRDAGNDVARAGRHERRLGQAETSQELQQLGQQIEAQTGAQVARAATAIAEATSPAQVQAAAKTAHDAIQAPLQDLTTSLQQALPVPGTAAMPPETPSQLAAAPEAAAKWMARALDSLDAAVNLATGQASPATQAQPGQPAEAGQAAQNAAAQAAKAAAQAQAGSMMAARSQGLAPGEQPIAPGISAGGGLNNSTPASETAPLPEVNPTGGKWGKLPPKLARDLIDSQREGVSGQYREMVEMYFRALADKAQEKQQ